MKKERGDAQEHEGREDDVEPGFDDARALGDNGALPGHPDVARVLE